jgi:DNA invertase Pin-like site-specific DNA recombinase
VIPSKICQKHLNRRAIVYLRQSTIKQVVEHTESTARQYALADRAQALGWPKAAVEVIDEDLGLSGTTTEARTGFRRLAEQVGKGEIGALFAIEVSRFARSSADWHQLLDLCGWGDVLIIDEQGVFDPKDPNDRLLLGLKGQMSEAEKYWMRLRMHGARLSRARRGELRLFAPCGYAWDDVVGGLVFDPDERVQATMRLFFDRFRTEGSAHGLQTWLIRNDVKLPVRHRGDPDLHWVAPRQRTVRDILHSPIYTGAYVFGRRETRMTMADGVRRISIRAVPREHWRVVIPDRHPAYLSWEQYVENMEKLKANQARPGSPTQHRAALKGTALLQGIVLCGRCGARMHVRYGETGRPNYSCNSPVRTGEGPLPCWSVAGTGVDAQVADAFLAASQPEELELALAVANEAARQADQLDGQWRLRIERAQYEARHAERRYKAVDPDNRVVARTLEAQWEEKLRELDEVERGHAQARESRKVVLTDADRRRILELARDLPAVWRSPTTTAQQRKNLLRILVREVTLTPIDVPTRSTRIQVLWESGAVTESVIRRARYTGGKRPCREIEEKVRELVAAGTYDREIVRALNDLPLAVRERTWNQKAVSRLRLRLAVARPLATPAHEQAPPRRADGAWSARGIAERFGVGTRQISAWSKQGLLDVIEGGGRGRPAWYRLDDADVARIEAHRAKRTNLTGSAS